MSNKLTKTAVKLVEAAIATCVVTGCLYLIGAFIAWDLWPDEEFTRDCVGQLLRLCFLAFFTIFSLVALNIGGAKKTEGDE